MQLQWLSEEIFGTSFLSSGFYFCMFCVWKLHFVAVCNTGFQWIPTSSILSRRNGDLGTLVKLNAINFLTRGLAVRSVWGGLFITDLNGVIKVFECHCPPRDLKSRRVVLPGKDIQNVEPGGNPLTHCAPDFPILQPNPAASKASLISEISESIPSHLQHLITGKTTCWNPFSIPQGHD